MAVYGRLQEAEMGKGWLGQLTKPAGHPNDGLLRQYVERRLSPETNQIIADHLGECSECQRRCTDMILFTRQQTARAA
jgi:hypothetical protein